MRNLHQSLTAAGVESYIFWGRRHSTISENEICFTRQSSVNMHGALSRITDRAGFYSRGDTRELIKMLDEIDPDVVHLHNLHGYYLDIRLLFTWLRSARCQVRWTLHDCWAFTGHCAYFDYVKCDRWRSGCFSCPQRGEYPKSYIHDSSKKNYSEKKEAFTSIPEDRMSIITPSSWLANLVKESFLSKYQVDVKPNTVNSQVFKPTPSKFRASNGLESDFLVLGVASPWTPRKGLQDFITLAKELDKTYKIILVGLAESQIRSLPENIIGFPRTDSAEELAEIYSSADVFLNMTYEDTYPTVNLEAEACGTPVITYASGGSAETISMPESRAVKPGSIDEVLRALKTLQTRNRQT